MWLALALYVGCAAAISSSVPREPECIPHTAPLPGILPSGEFKRAAKRPVAVIPCVRDETVCTTEAGTETCYRETGRALWLDQPHRPKIRRDNCWLGVWCSTAQVLPMGISAIPLAAVATAAYDPRAKPVLCENHVAPYVQRRLFAEERWYSRLKLRISYEVQRNGSLANETMSYAIRLPDGSCDNLLMALTYSGKFIFKNKLATLH